MVVRASADEPRRDSGDPSDSAPPPPAGAYAGWWTRADAAAALAVAAERDGDDDAVRLEDASRALSPPAAPWLEMLELSATFGAAGGGLAALLLQETALVALIAALPLVAYGARAKRDALARRFAAETLLEAREETECARRKTASLVSAADVASAAANEAVRLTATRTSRTVDAAVDKGVGAIKRDLAVLGSGVAESRRESREVARATDALSRDVRSASASALRAAKESGSVAGMLAKDVAASRVDAREAFDLLAGLLAESAEETERRDGETKDEVAFELGVLAETVGNLEKSLAKLSAENDDDVVASVSVSSENDESERAKTTNESATRASSELTAQSLEALARAASAAKAAASAAERAAAAAEKASSSASSVRNDDAYDDARDARDARDRYPTPVVAKLDAEQWSLLGARLTQLEEAAAAAAAEAAAEAGKAVGRVRAGVREDIRGASDALAAAAEAAVETPKTGTRRRLGQDEDWNPKGDLPPKAPSDDASKGALPFGLPFEFAERVAVPASEAAAASAFGRIAAEAALSEDSELEGRSRDGLPPINAAVGLTKEAAFENMQALLREKSDETGSDVLRKEKEKAPAVSTSAPAESATRTEEEKEEEEWSARPVRVSLATGRDGRVVATLATRGEKGAESVDEIRTSGFATDDGSSRETARLARGDEENAEECAFDVARARLDEGLASLRAARLAARDAGSNPTRMLEADAGAAAAVANLEAAAEAFDRLANDANDAGPNDAGPNEKDFPTIFAGAAAARGNLGNALLARGRLQVRLSSMAASQERRASLAGVRAGAEGAAAFHAEIAEECLVLAGRAFRKALASRDPFRKSGDSDSDSDSERDSRNAEKRSAGAARALTGWGAALALRGDAALASAARRRDASLASRSRENISDVSDADVAFAVSASEAAALAAAASEKYRAALELETNSDSDSDDDESHFSIFTAETRARAFTDWGDALRLAARAAASALAATSGPGFEPGRGQEFESVFDAARLPPPGECWARAEACYEEAMRWDAEGCGEDARRGLRACAEAFR